jgi:trk system potassium uptake protein TrkH
MFISAGVAFFDPLDNSSFFPLLVSAFITALVGVFPLIFVPSDLDLSLKEIYCIVVFAWLSGCFFGMLPYIMYGGEFSVTNAWFESVSGFTTTGASILNDIEALPKGILLWRASTHFIGGVGVIVFVLLVLPGVGTNRSKLSKVEISPLAQDNFKFRSQQMIRVILGVYIGITIAAAISLLLAGMPLFDAICHSFSTVATGGFSTKNTSIAAFNSGKIELVLIIFMVISGMHFGMIYSTLVKRSKALFRSTVTRFYLFSMLIGSTLIALNLVFSGQVGNFFESVRQSVFQVVAITTTTGFATVNTSIWPSVSILILMYFMIQCACAGSTSGGIKADRVYITYKAIMAQIRKNQHPNAVIPVRVQGIKVENDVVSAVLLYIVFFFLIIFATTILLSLMGLNFMASVSLSLSSMSNVGPAFDAFHSMSNWDSIPILGKLLLSFVMLLGRLEIYGVLVLFYIRGWR